MEVKSIENCYSCNLRRVNFWPASEVKPASVEVSKAPLELHLVSKLNCFVLGNVDRDPNAEIFHFCVIIDSCGNLDKVRRMNALAYNLLFNFELLQPGLINLPWLIYKLYYT